MSTKAFPRIYKNNSMYAEDKLPCIDALALTVQKFFYTKRNAVYYLAGTIELWDFMTLTRYYIAASTSEFGQSDIETYISAMDDPSAQMFGGKAVEYTKDRDHIILYGTPAMVLSLMWAAWIYAKMRLSVAGDDKKPLWQRAAELLYNSMKDFYDDPDHKCFGESNRLLSIADDAVNTMGTYAAEKIRKSRNIQAQQPVPAKEHPVPANNDSAQLQSRIAELEAENKELKEQIEKVRNQEKGISLGLNQGQAALFGLALANTFGFKYTNKKKQLAPMLHKLFGWGESKIARELGSNCEKEERNELASLFEDLCPKLYESIMNWGERPPEETPEATP